MSSDPIPVEISSGRDSLIIGVTIEQETSIMPLQSSFIPNNKRGAHWPKSPVPKKWTTITSSFTEVEVVE